MQERVIKNYIGVTHGLRGWFAVHMAVYNTGLVEPVLTGPGSYDTRAEAVVEARDWADAESLPLEV